ncbi:MAG TPA: methyltransferase domain-containing protein [Candidatus Nanoarchaeia archaeon]|nr:methyltransferase domain-containing protein [Candidatus Nanoarchaeia archaeon]
MKIAPNTKKALLLIFICVLLSYPLTGWTAEKHHQKPLSQQRFNEIQKWVDIFEDPERAEWQKPEEVVKKLELKPGDTVADIGAGTGYFTRLFATAVGPEGKAIGLDIEPSMVDYMKEDARKRALKNYEALVVKPDDTGLSSRSVHVIFICNTYHHIEDRVNYLKRLSQALKPNGRIVIVDFYKKPLPVGPQSVAHKISEEDVKKEFKKAGYRLKKSLDFLPYQYYLEFSL